MVACEIRDFPALGFDPAPGNAGAIQDVVGKLLDAQVQLGECANRMTEALDVCDDWDGDAADDFHDYGDDLPSAFSSGSTSMANAATALSTWYGQLTANQQTAELLEKQAQRLKTAAAQAHRDVTTAAHHAANAKGHQQASANIALSDAIRTASAADIAVQQVINRAKLVQRRHLSQANAAAAGVKSGDDGSFQPANDNWLVQVTDGVAKSTDIVSTVSGTVAAASLVVPGVGEVVAPVAGTVAAGAGAVHTVAAIGQQGLGSHNAGSTVDIVVGAIPAKAITGPAGALTKGLLKRGARQALTTTLADAGKAGRDGLADSTFARTVRGLRGTSKPIDEQLTEKGKGLANVLNRLPGKDAVDAGQYQTLGRIRSGHEAASGLVGSADEVHQALDPDYRPAAGDKRALNLLKTALNPSGDAFADWGKSEAADAGKNVFGK